MGPRLVATLVLIPLLAGVACSGEQVVTAEELGEQVSAALADQVGREPDEVSCPEDLEARVDAEARCELSDSGSTYGVTVRVTSIDDGRAEFDIQVDPEPS